MCSFFEFLVSAEIGYKSKMSATLVDNLTLAAIFRRGRREWRGAGEEKEEGVLRAVDRGLKS